MLFMFLNKTYKQFVIETVSDVCPFKKKSKYSYSYYFDMFILVLKHVNSWNSLSITSNYKNKTKYHYTTVRKMFNKWSSYDVFKLAYIKLLKHNNLYTFSQNDDLFIDTCFISNKTGSELVGLNPMYYKKNVTKLSIICNKNKIPLSIVPFKSTTNDSKTIIKSIESLHLHKTVNLIADKGYINSKINKNILLKHHKVKLITPKKKNQKNVRISRIMKSKLKIRNVVENCIQLIKSADRIMVRKDNNLNNYISFVYMNCGLKIYNKIK